MIEIGEVRIYSSPGGSSIEGIPSDDGSHFQLEYFEGAGDPHLRIFDPSLEVFFLPMRFRTSLGGGALPMIAEELTILPEALRRYHGQIPPNIKQLKYLEDRLPTHITTKVKVGKNPNESRYSITGIESDDDLHPSWFMDLFVCPDGNVVLVQRRSKLFRAEMIFRTGENGGKYPIMAAVFNNIAERIAKTSLGAVYAEPRI